MDPQAAKSSWKFPKDFWTANFIELCERMAYYGFFIVLTLYLTNVVGFSDKETGIIGGIFYAGIYFINPFVGALGDRIGFRKGVLITFTSLAIGYSMLGFFHTKGAVLIFLLFVMFGSAFIKPLISGTVAKTTKEENRARGYSLFYWVVNIGAFLGKTFVPFIRQDYGLINVNFFSAIMSLLALAFAFFFYHPEQYEGKGKTTKETFEALKKVVKTPRLIFLILIVSGFWITQGQLYATMPKYVIRLLGDQAKPEWLANVNPFIVVVFVVLITNLMKKKKAITSILVGMLLMPVSAFAMSFGKGLSSFTGNEISIMGFFTLHPLTVMLIIGIAIQGFAECFISPRYLEYFSLQAPKGEEGLYLGFGNLYNFFSSLAGFILSGFLLDAYCPDPKTLPANLTPEQFASYYAHAHYIWYYFIGTGLISVVALLIYRHITNKIDSQKEKALAN